jgi:hypothetical protein
MKPALLILALALAITACSSENEPEKGTSVAVDATGKDGEKVSVTADGATGNVALKTPGFDANFRLPKALLNDNNFDIDGVKLYPGSTIDSINVKAEEKDGKGSGNVVILFTAPDEPGKVGNWFAKEFGENSMPVTSKDGLLVGKTKDGTDFSITLTPADGGKTSGRTVISG